MYKHFQYIKLVINYTYNQFGIMTLGYYYKEYNVYLIVSLRTSESRALFLVSEDSRCPEANPEAIG